LRGQRLLTIAILTLTGVPGLARADNYLTVTVFNGGYSAAGSVTSSPSGINCGTECVMSVAQSPITLTAAAGAGFEFQMWGGHCDGSQTTCVLPSFPTTDLAVQAYFRRPCETWTCDGGTCTYGPSPPGGACDDGNPCTEVDTCDGSGACSGTLIDCKPPACQSATCNPSTGVCEFASANEGAVCPTSGGACVVGHCASRACAPSNLPNGTTCEDGLGCTYGDSCQSGVCVSGAAS
jgi:Divergent InlB B-repeat domain